MSMGARSSRSVLAFVLALALAVPAFSPGVAFAATDDDIPGVAIPASPIVDTLDQTTDPDDVYAVDLVAGESFTATLTGDPGTDFDALLFGPGATSVLGPDAPVAEAPVPTYPEVISYTALSSGTYYLDVQAFSGAGAYSAEWATATAEPVVLSDDNIPGAVTLPASPVVGTLDDVTDVDDVYRVHLAAGEQLDVSLDWADPNPDAAFEAFLFSPDATNILTDVPTAASIPDARPATFSFVAPATGDYFLDLYAKLGTGAYTLDYTITPALPADGNGDISTAETLTTSPVSGSLNPDSDVHDVYKVAISKGQTFSVELTAIGNPTPEFFVDLYQPGTGSIAETLPLTTGDNSGFVYEAQESGEYYLDVSTAGSLGSYQLIWSLGRLPVDIQVALPARVGWARSTNIEATLTAANGPIAGVSADIEAKPYGALAFQKIGSAQTDGSGHLSFAVTPAKRTEYRIVFGQADLYESKTSNVLTCIPYAYVTAPSARKTTYAVNEYLVTAGYLKPRHKAGLRDLRVFAQRYEKQPNGSYKWVTRRTYYAKLVNYGTYTKYSTAVRLPYRGKWRLRAYVIGNTTHASTWSAARYLTVR